MGAVGSSSQLDGFVRWIRHCNTADYHRRVLPLVCGGQHVGFCKPNFAERLSSFKSVFKVDEQSISFQDDLDSSEKRTSAVAAVLKDLRGQGLITGWRDELYPATESFHAEPCFLLERAAAVQFGVRSYGVHMNGFVRDGSGLKLWVARRSRSKPTWPGKLDHMCAGGQPYGISPTENMVKECAEEASIPEALARAVRPAGAISYAQLQNAGLKRDCLFCYDLELPSDFMPTPGDSEVESFELMDIGKVADIIRATDDFKDNCNLVIIDFMIRHGVLRPESPGYLELVAGLRQLDCC